MLLVLVLLLLLLYLWIGTGTADTTSITNVRTHLLIDNSYKFMGTGTVPTRI